MRFGVGLVGIVCLVLRAACTAHEDPENERDRRSSAAGAQAPTAQAPAATGEAPAAPEALPPLEPAPRGEAETAIAAQEPLPGAERMAFTSGITARLSLRRGAEPLVISFDQAIGTIELTPGDWSKTRINIGLGMYSANAPSDELTALFKSSRFFDVARYPNTMIGTTEISQTAQSGSIHQVSVMLDIRGRTARVAFGAVIEMRSGAVVFAGTIPLRRTAFGLPDLADSGGALGDAMELRLEFTAPRPARQPNELQTTP